MKWGRWIISFIALFTSVSPYLADWNETHIYNPYWPPHAKFHNAQTMLFGAMTGMLSLYFLWRTKTDPKTTLLDLQVGTLFAAFYWVTQAPAILFPGTSFNDPQFQGLPAFKIGSLPITQVVLDAVIVGILLFAYWREAAGIGRTVAPNTTKKESP